VILALSLDPKTILDSLHPYGEVGLWLMIFAETGLLIGFFLPGDSLLFTAGLLASQGSLDATLVILGCFIAAVIGDAVGYTIGRQVGPRLFARPDSKVFKQAYVERTSAFFDRRGPKTVLLARFVPVVRTFTPVMAGVGGMRRRTFTIYNIIGAFIWAVGITLAGYALSSAIGSSIDTYLYPIVAAIVVVSLIPPLLEWRRAKRVRNAAEAPDTER
jgi:membrane-associated protein